MSTIKRERSLARWEPSPAVARAIKKEADRIGNVPNAQTVRALRSKKRGKTFSSGKEAIAYLKSL